MICGVTHPSKIRVKRALEIMTPDSSSFEAQGRTLVTMLNIWWINQVANFHPCRIQLLSILLSSDQDVPLLNGNDLMETEATRKGMAHVHCATTHGAHPGTPTEATLAS